jgi:FkbM family methyltransferase
MTSRTDTVVRRASNLARCRHMVPLHRNPVRAFRNRFHLAAPGREVEYRLADRTVLTVETGPSDIIAINEIWGESCYEPTGSFRLRPGWKVIDLGAHKGAFSVRAARAGASAVLAVEPDERNLDFLRRNVARNGATSVRIIGAAVAEASGTGLLHRSSSPTGHVVGTSISTEDGQPSHEVRLVTLPELIQEIGGGVDMLKVDVEGSEFEAFAATPRLAWAEVDRVVMEFHRPPGGGSKRDGATQLDALLASLGFEVSIDHDRWLIHAHRSTRTDGGGER